MRKENLNRVHQLSEKKKKREEEKKKKKSLGKPLVSELGNHKTGCVNTHTAGRLN